MHRNTWLVGSTLAAIALIGDLSGTNPETKETQESSEKPASKLAQHTAISAFTGRITKNKVRMRIQPNLDAKILTELTRDDLLVVVGESEDFYAIKPPADTKGYVFRTFVLDGTVEGDRVNVRLEPELDAPIIAQLNKGEHVEGSISPLNSKWLEISPPTTVRFYVAKEYIEKIGDPDLMARIQKRREEVNNLLSTAYTTSQTELQKPFPQIDLNGVVATFNKIIQQYGDFPEQVARAREVLTSLQEKYLQSKIAYLETKAQLLDKIAQNSDSTQQEGLQKLQEQFLTASEPPVQETIPGTEGVTGKTITAKMALWNSIEQKQFEEWLKENPEGTSESFYAEQAAHGVTLRGIVENYNRNIKNKPGDYLLVNPATHLPTAYLYSTQINLQDLVGHEITIKASPRPNNNFAFPAYFVISHD